MALTTHLPSLRDSIGFSEAHPALKRWAKIFCAYGAGSLTLTKFHKSITFAGCPAQSIVWIEWDITPLTLPRLRFQLGVPIRPVE